MSRPTKETNIDQEAMGITPRQVLQLFSPAQWEEFTLEWMDGFSEPYVHKDRLGGPGDMGRDVVGYLGPLGSDPEWDNYQCKHYGAPLQPTNVYGELGKLCVYTHRKKFRIPRRYRFVSPFGVGPKLFNMLSDSTQLRTALIDNWDGYCSDAISDTESIPLSGDLKAYVEAFDFRIVGYVPVNDILEQHSRTKYWTTRFKLEPPTRPPVGVPPPDVQANEVRYLALLFGAYSDHLKLTVTCLGDLQAHSDVRDHYHRTREHFYSAEMLNRFSRDNFNVGAFDRIKQQIYSGVADVAAAEHVDALRRVIATTQRSLDVPLARTELQPYVESSDRQGLCHHLAHDDRLKWVKP